MKSNIRSLIIICVAVSYLSLSAFASDDDLTVAGYLEAVEKYHSAVSSCEMKIF